MEKSKLVPFLRPNLDILFVGLNPAKGSSDNGHKGYNNAEQIHTCTENNITTYVAVQDVPRSSDIPTQEYYGDKFIYNKSDDTYTCPQQNTLTTTGH